MRRFSSGFVRILASRKFFWFIVFLLVFQAAWLALSFSYPMLWDEYYHFGLIQFYGHHLSPFITNQPHSLDLYGNVERSPKYLYHYLLSFPYRLILAITKDQTAQIITLRFLNIALFAGGLVAWRAGLLKITKSRSLLVHLALFILVLLPLSSLLAAQINYDNLVFLLAALLVYWAIKFIQADKFQVKWLVLEVSVGLLACVVKLEIAPVFAALAIYLAYFLARHYGKDSWRLAAASLKSLNRWSKVGLVLLLVISLGLFGERFGVNLVRYHALQPGCAKVLDDRRCQNFSPYSYEQSLRSEKPASAQLENPLVFLGRDWLGGMYEQFFSSGTRLAPRVYTIQYPLVVPYVTIALVGVLALLAFVWRGRRLARRPEIQLALLVIFALALALFITNYVAYLQNGTPWAIQGRYMLPAVPLLMIVGLESLALALKRRPLKVALASIAILGLLAGGGLMTDIIVSQPNWDWQNQTVIQVNNSARNALDFLNVQLH